MQPSRIAAIGTAGLLALGAYGLRPSASEPPTPTPEKAPATPDTAGAKTPSVPELRDAGAKDAADAKAAAEKAATPPDSKVTAPSPTAPPPLPKPTGLNGTGGAALLELTQRHLNGGATPPPTDAPSRDGPSSGRKVFSREALRGEELRMIQKALAGEPIDWSARPSTKSLENTIKEGLARREKPSQQPDSEKPAASNDLKTVQDVTVDAHTFQNYSERILRDSERIANSLVRREGYRAADISGRGQYTRSDVIGLLVHYPPLVTDPTTGEPVMPLKVTGPDGKSIEPIKVLAAELGGTLEANMRDRANDAAQKALQRFFDASTPERLAAAQQEIAEILKGDPSVRDSTEFPKLWIDRSADPAKQLHKMLQPRPGEVLDSAAVVDLLRAEFHDYGSLERIKLEWSQTFPHEDLKTSLMMLDKESRAYVAALDQKIDLDRIAKLLETDLPTGIGELHAIQQGIEHLPPEKQELVIQWVGIVRSTYNAEKGMPLIDAIHAYHGANGTTGSSTHVTDLVSVLTEEGYLINRGLQKHSVKNFTRFAQEASNVTENEALQLAAERLSGVPPLARAATDSLIPERELEALILSLGKVPYFRREAGPDGVKGTKDDVIREEFPTDLIREALADSPPNFELVQEILGTPVTNNFQKIAIMRAAQLHLPPGKILAQAIEEKIPADATPEMRMTALRTAILLRGLEFVDGVKTGEPSKSIAAFQTNDGYLGSEDARLVSEVTALSGMSYSDLVTRADFGPSEKATLRFLARGIDIRAAVVDRDTIGTHLVEFYGQAVATTAATIVNTLSAGPLNDAATAELINALPAGSGADLNESFVAYLGAPPDVDIRSFFERENAPLSMAAFNAKLVK